MMGRRVLVTGSSRGIGEAVARAFADLGDRVAVHYTSDEDAASAVHSSLDGSGHLLVRADLRKREELRLLVEEVTSHWGGIDILVNNAGVVHRVEFDCEDFDDWEASWDDTFDVNVLGTAMLTWHVMRVMGSGGRIINLSSRAAFRGMPDSISYAASKAALAAMTQSLAQAVAPRGIAVTALAPGYVETDMGRLVLDGPRGEAIREESPFRRVASTDEIAEAIVYLAGEKSEWASGAILDLNGASHLRL